MLGEGFARVNLTNPDSTTLGAGGAHENRQETLGLHFRPTHAAASPCPTRATSAPRAGAAGASRATGAALAGARGVLVVTAVHGATEAEGLGAQRVGAASPTRRFTFVRCNWGLKMAQGQNKRNTLKTSFENIMYLGL